MSHPFTPEPENSRRDETAPFQSAALDAEGLAPAAHSSPGQPHPLPGAPTLVIREGAYLIRFAQNEKDLSAALRLRYEVFNLELGEGLEQSHASGRDEDTFDAGCHHLIVEHEPTGQIIGTYRMQTQEMAEANGGFYSDGEFDLSGFPHAVLKQSVELGRACVAQEHRRQRVLFGLWKGLAAYVTFMNKRYLFGCCSLTSQDPQQGRMVLEKLRLDGLIHPDYIVKPRPDMLCEDSNSPIADPSSVKLPTLFGTYLRFGALVCSPPAIDREFKTIDYLVLMDSATLPARTRATFFGD
ncbi:MAG: GNAT family N-acyltransferase [Planctomycetota bacterium]|nr:GNAT family N-acyltransferase [Planctomycetota bacterium]